MRFQPGSLLRFFIPSHSGDDEAEKHRQCHIRQCVSDRRVHAHQDSVGHKSDDPDHQVLHVGSARERLLLKDKIVRDLDRDHGREDGTDQVQKVRDVVHGIDDRGNSTDHGDHDSCPLLTDLLRDRDTGYTGGIGVEESRRHRREDDDQKTCHTEACFHHDGGDVIGPRVDGGAHADHIHEDTDRAVDQHADGRRRHRLLRFPGVVTDKRQPGERHRDAKFNGRAEAQAVIYHRFRRVFPAEDHNAQDDAQDQKTTINPPITTGQTHLGSATIPPAASAPS